MILYIKHIDIEGPGTLGEFFENKGYSSQTIEITKNESLPEDIHDYKAIISLGGPMNVYEEEKYPFLKKENEFIQRAMDEEIPFMGICLGSQLLAKAAGAEVNKSPNKEIGFFDVKLTDSGLNDPLFKDIQKEAEVFQWHEDMLDVPSGADLLAQSALCPHQAFRIGKCAYGIQFHFEITDLSIKEWTEKYIRNHKESSDMKNNMLNDYQIKKDKFGSLSNQICKNFHSIIELQKVNV